MLTLEHDRAPKCNVAMSPYGRILCGVSWHFPLVVANPKVRTSVRVWRKCIPLACQQCVLGFVSCGGVGANVSITSVSEDLSPLLANVELAGYELYIHLSFDHRGDLDQSPLSPSFLVCFLSALTHNSQQPGNCPQAGRQQGTPPLFAVI